MSWDDFQKQIKDQLLMFDYVRAKDKGLLDTVKPVTDADIQDFYDAHKREEFLDDVVIIRHIFIDTRALVSKEDKDKARKRADDILKELKGGASFGEYRHAVFRGHRVEIQERRHRDVHSFRPAAVAAFRKGFLR